MVIPGLQSSDAFLRLQDPEARGSHFGLRTGAHAVELAKYPPLSTPTVGLAVTSGRADPSPSFPPLPLAQTRASPGSREDHNSQNATRGVSQFLFPGFHSPCSLTWWVGRLRLANICV